MSNRPHIRLQDILKLGQTELSDMLKAAVECYAEEDWLKAEGLALGILSLEPRNASALKLLASTLLLQDRHREAEHVYQEAHAADPADLYVLGALAELKLQSLKLEEAIPLFEKLFAADPDHEHPAANRGRAVVHEYHRRLGGG